jgi:ankyrin repeat protein
LRRGDSVVAGPVCVVLAVSRAELAAGRCCEHLISPHTVQGQTALIRAAEGGNEPLLKELIAVNANLNAVDVIYLSCARVIRFQSASDFPRLT